MAYDKSKGCVIHIFSEDDPALYIDRARPIHGLHRSFWSVPSEITSEAKGDKRAELRVFEMYVRETGHLRDNLRMLYGRTLSCGCDGHKTKDGRFKPLYVTVPDREVCHGQTLLRLAAERVEKIQEMREEQEAADVNR
jgi:hypothetical protein